MSPLVSVVVPTYRRPDLLARCLEALASQEFDPADYEVLVVDDAGDPATRQVVEQFAGQNIAVQRQPIAAGAALSTPYFYDDPAVRETDWIGQDAAGFNVRYLAADESDGPAAARNRGWRAACGEIIAFTDDDCIPQPDWLRRGMEAFCDEAVMGAGGRLIVPLPPAPTDFERTNSGLERSEFITANCFYRRAALKEVGGFDERFKTAWREDSDLYFRLLKRGCDLVKVPEAVVLHPVRPAPWGISLRQQRKSMYNALIYKKHPRLFREKLQPAPPWLYYGILAGLATGFAGAATGSLPVILLGFSAWLALTLRFFWRRIRGTKRTAGHILEMLVTSILIPPVCVYWRLRGAVMFRVFFL